MNDTVIRAFELPLQHAEPHVWPLLRECWKQATMLANWCVMELARHDVTRMGKMAKLPPYPYEKLHGRKLKGLYGRASESFRMKSGWWAGACISAATVCREVERAYHQDRFAVLWQCKQALRLYRYPYPWPIHAQSWKAAGLGEHDGKPWVEVVLPGGKARLQLRGGPEFGRQMGLFRQVVKGELPRLALVIREQPANRGCHRPGVESREAGGGARQFSRVMVKMVAKLPVKEKPGERVLTLCTDPNAFWVAELDGRQAWVLNNDHMRRAFEWQAVHAARLLRLAQDAKAERRLNPEALDALNDSRRRCCDKHHRRLSSWLHETAAHLVGFAARQKVGRVLYRDVKTGFIPSFPWHRLKTLLKDKLTAAGIVLDCASDNTEGPDDAISA